MKLKMQILLMALVGAAAMPGVAFAQESEGGEATAAESTEAAPAAAEASEAPAEASGDDAAAASGGEVAAAAEAGEERECRPEIPGDCVETARSWGFSAGFGTSIGQGTFVDPANDTEYADEVDPGDNAYDRANMSLSLSANYNIGDSYQASVGVAWVQWLTAGGDANYPNALRFQDVSLDFLWLGAQLGGGFMVNAFGGLVFPTSDISQTSSLIVGTSAGGTLIWSGLGGSIALIYQVGGGKDFHEFTSPAVDEEEVGYDNVIWREGGSQALGQGLYAIDGVNTEWALSNTFAASFGVVERLRLVVSYGISTFWSYDVFDEDEFTPDVENINTDRGVAQIVRTGVNFNYPLIPVAQALGLQVMNVSFGVRSSMQPKTDDNQSFRFPFWNFDGAARNMSQVRFGISAVY